MKKLLSILLTFVMVFSFVGMTASATEETNGKITITKPAKDTEYNIYRILKVDTHTDDYSSVTYRVADGWEAFFDMPEVQEYIAKDGNGAITGKSTFTQSTAPAFAKLAIEYAKNPTNNVEPYCDPIIANGSDDVVFSNLKLGYYLVDTSIGALCGLTTTQPNASVSLKNLTPTITKQVEEDSNAGTDTSAWSNENTADIDQIVNYDVTIYAQAGAENYVYHDKFDDAFNLIYDNTKGGGEDGIVVKYHKASPSETRNLQKGVEYTISTNTNNCSFEIAFDQSFLSTLSAEDRIYILYSAKLNSNATSEGNINEGWLSYGDNHKTATAVATTYTYGFEIVKTDAMSNMLAGAKFKLFANETDTEAISLVKLNDNSYRRATEAEIAEGANVVTEIEVKLIDNKSIAKVHGFDNDVYYLRETENPKGYNAMVGNKIITISNSDIEASFDADGAYKPGTGVQVINQKGTVLPTTGGMGTTLFVSLGAIVVMGTGVLLVTKKRMSMIDD